MNVSENVQRFYPDLIELGGLAHTLRSALAEIGSALTVSTQSKGTCFVAYARVESKQRFSQVMIASEERMFLLDFWARGVYLADGGTPHLNETARAIDTWVASSCPTLELAAAFSFVTVKPEAAIYERGEEVEERWQSYIKDVGFPELSAFVEAAARRPELRQLFPYTSLNNFHLSRCTGFPFTGDIPFVHPVKEHQYEVVSRSGLVLGRGNAEQAVELLVANLPPGCGRAVPGTADDMGGDEPDTTRAPG